MKGQKKTQKPQKPLALWIHGSSGRMGQAIQAAVLGSEGRFFLAGGSAEKFEGEPFYQGKVVTPEKLTHALARIDLILDFSSPAGNELLLEAFARGELKKKAILIGTTGLEEDVKLRWRSIGEAQKLRILFAPNTSLGVLVLMQTALTLSRVLVKRGFDIEIVETHHSAKKDAPSGTARLIAESLSDQNGGLRSAPARRGPREKGEIGLHSVRGGTVFGEHEVRFLGPAEELALVHKAGSRELFAHGALTLGRWLVDQPHRSYGLNDVDLASF